MNQNTVAQQTSEDIISYFERFMDNQDILKQEVEKVAPSLGKEKLIDIVKKCSNKSENKKSGYKRLCGTFLVWMQSVDELVNVEEWIQTYLNKGGATQPYQWKKIVENWERLQSLAENEGKNAYEMSINDLNGLEERIQRTKLQWILAKLGSKEGYSSWIPLNDRIKTHDGQSLRDLSLEQLPPSKFSNEIENNIKVIDLIWFENNQIHQIFKIEWNKKKISPELLLQISDFILLTKLPFSLVIHREATEKANTALSRPTFEEIKLRNRFNMRASIEDWEEAWETENLNLIKKKILLTEGSDTALGGEANHDENADICPDCNSEFISTPRESTGKDISHGINYSYPEPEVSKEVDALAMEVAIRQVKCLYPNKIVEQMEHNNPGFDILVKKDGNNIAYVEVKGTQKSIPSFFMSERQRRFSEENADKSCWLIVYNINLVTKEYQIFMHHGAVTKNKFTLAPIIKWSVQTR